MTSWFQTERLNDGVIRITERFVHEFYRSNLYRISGRDFDIQLDFGVSVQSLSEVSPPSGYPVLAIASHAHVDHIGSFHQYARRAGHIDRARRRACRWCGRIPRPRTGRPKTACH